MKITVDTKVDTHEEIRHAIQILSNLLERKGYSSAAPEVSPKATTNMMSMFGDSSPNTPSSEPTATPMSMFSNTPTKQAPDTGPDLSSFLNLANQEEKKDEEPKVEYF